MLSSQLQKKNPQKIIVSACHIKALFAGTGIAAFHVNDEEIWEEERQLNPVAKIEKINHFNGFLICQTA